MKKHRWFAALAAMVMVLAVAGCSDGSSGNEFATGSSGGSGNSSGTGNSRVDYSKCAVGDFVLKDGTMLPKDITLTDTQKSNVAAVIVRAAADGKPALGVGIVHSKSGLAWCGSKAAGYYKTLTDLQGDTKTGYMDGSDGWEKLKAACSDAESHPNWDYPAWNYSLTYAEKNSLKGDLATGWYFPTVAELYTIYQNITAVHASLSKAGGSTFGTNSYWSCCQYSNSNIGAIYWNFSEGYMAGDDKTNGGVSWNYHYVCSVRAFN